MNSKELRRQRRMLRYYTRAAIRSLEECRRYLTRGVWREAKIQLARTRECFDAAYYTADVMDLVLGNGRRKEGV